MEQKTMLTHSFLVRIKALGIIKLSALILFISILPSMALFAAPSPQQQRAVSGVVLDEAGAPIVGASVTVRGTTRGSITNPDGTFSLRASEGETLEVAYVGYVGESVVVDSRSEFRIVMREDAQQLDEVVVIGYGTARKRDVAGAISAISNRDLNIQSVTNVQNLFQGRLAGVSVSSNGVPGEAPSVRVRGIGTIGVNTPLYVVDGIPMKSEIATQINPANIENVQVLKDAASASIYGAQAANGVILMTTKQGRAGKTQVTVRLNTGVQIASNLPEMLNSQQYGDVLWAAMKNAGTAPQHPQYGSGATPVIPDYLVPNGAMEGTFDLSDYNTVDKQYMRANKAGTNWQKEVYRPAQVYNINVSAQGGSEDSRYYMSADYLSQDAVLKWSGYDKVTLMGNSEFTILKNVKLGANMNVNYSKYTGSTENYNAALMPAIIPVRDVMGNWAGAKGNGLGDIQNPVANLYNARHNYTERQNFLGNVYLDIKIVNNLVFRSTAGANMENWNRKAFSPVTFWNRGDKNNLLNSLEQREGHNRQLTWNNTLTYTNTFADDHNLTVMVGSEALDYRTESMSASRDSFASEDPDYRFLDAGEGVTRNNGGSGSQYALFSLFARASYNYKEKYYLEGIIRRDGSSRFGANNRYGYFPGVSAAWRISGENFMADQNVVSDLKLRLSYGVVGNSEIGDYAFASSYAGSMANTGYPIDGSVGSVVTGIAMEAMGNPDLKWESSATANIGLDASFLKNRLSFSLDVYNRRTTDMLQRPAYPSTAGYFYAPYSNIGAMRVNGVDFSANFRNHGQGDFGYDIGVVLSAYRNKVTQLYGGNYITSGTFSRTYVGQPVGMFYGYILDGIFQDQAEVDAHVTQTAKAIGRWKFRNVDNNDRINDSDRTFIGNPHPDFEYSLNGRFYYKNFDLNMFFQGVYGNDILFESKYGQNSIDFAAEYFNKSVRILDSWTPDNRDAKLPLITGGNPNAESNKVTTYLVEDGSYLRLKTLELGYTLPSTLLSKINITNARVYLSAENLFTITKYSNIDPEVRTGSDSGDDLRMGVDGLNTGLPIAKVFSVGLSVSF